ncbi:hypothetical protein GUJ93_ZPchr0010g8801 [Zizania palustris]|uniref:DUF868 family protein n=1 Tax=Zizania palustris TaxID=103762 RepID=A0A8J5WC97_ZIZPA|nr:hypothetical protein GUJ93_ZPchr0010g8801 [Zizania palustris]
MPSVIAACFRCAPTGSCSGPAPAGPSLATSVYETHLGVAALSWTRTSLGLSLRAVLRLSLPRTPASSSAFCGAGYFDDDADEETLAFRVRPWLLWRRRGSRRFRAGDLRVELAWDLTRARFPGSGSPEPSSGFFVAVVVDGEMALAAGDLSDEAYRKTRARRPPGPRPVLLSRCEHVAMRDAGRCRGHRSWVTVRGKEREISVDLVSRSRGRERSSREKDRADVGLSISIDGERVLHVRRLRWKFRGSERVDLGGGDRVQLSWDLHNWLFPSREPPPADTSAHVHAVFVFRFELDGCERREEAEEAKVLSDKARRRDTSGILRGYFARWGGKDWTETRSNSEGKKGSDRRRLAKASSSSSPSAASSTASWASGSTVMDWASPEEAEMQRGDGFSLLIYASKC